MTKEINTPGLGDEIRNFLADRVQAIKLRTALYCASGDPFVDIIDTPGIGQLTEVKIRKGKALVFLPMKEATLFPARNVHLLDESAVQSE